MSWLDRLGSVASATCALHCAAMPLLPALAPMIGALDETLEWGFFTLAMLLAVGAGWMAHRTHGSGVVLLGFGVGLVLLGTGRAAEAFSLFDGGGLLAIAGGCVLVLSHVRSMRCGRACADCPVEAA